MCTVSLYRTKIIYVFLVSAMLDTFPDLLIILTFHVMR
jgi:hypothetical protein